MSESLRNDGRIWVPKQPNDKRSPDQIPEEDRDYYLERMYPSFGNLSPRDISSRAAKRVCDEGRGVGETGLGVYLDFRDSIQRLGENTIRELQDPEAHLPGCPLHDGRLVGGLQPAIDDSWIVCVG
jgi:succinate dehydrogenase / fumarate reductase flavoprotein subunit